MTNFVKKASLDMILDEEFPELGVMSLWIPDSCNVTSSEFSNTIKQVKENRLIENSEAIFLDSNKNINLIGYEIKFPDQEKEIYFDIEKTKKQGLFKGIIKTIGEYGAKIPDITLYNMHLRY